MQSPADTAIFVVSGKSPITMPGGLGSYAYNVATVCADLQYQTYVVGFSDRDEIVTLDSGIKLIHVRTGYDRLVSVGAFLIIPQLAAAMKSVIEENALAQVIVFGAGIWSAAGVRLRRMLPDTTCKVTAVASYFTTAEHEYGGQVKGAPVEDYGLLPHLFVRTVFLYARTVLKPAEHRLFRGLDRIIVHYDSTRAILLNEVKRLDADKITKIPYYVDAYTRESDVKLGRDRGSDLPTVSVICRQDPRKGINTFLKAVKLLHDRQARFRCLVVGSGIFLEHNKRLARKLGLADSVEFLGFVDNVIDVLRGTDIYVLPSLEEGSGAISLLEAMEMGVAIVTTTCDGIPEDFVHDETALLVEPGDEVQLAGALEELIRNPEKRSALARNARDDYPRRFSFAKFRAGLGELIGLL